MGGKEKEENPDQKESRQEMTDAFGGGARTTMHGQHSMVQKPPMVGPNLPFRGIGILRIFWEILARKDDTGPGPVAGYLTVVLS